MTTSFRNLPQAAAAVHRIRDSVLHLRPRPSRSPPPHELSSNAAALDRLGAEFTLER